MQWMRVQVGVEALREPWLWLRGAAVYVQATVYSYVQVCTGASAGAGAGVGCWYAGAVGLKQFQRRALGWAADRC